MTGPTLGGKHDHQNDRTTSPGGITFVVVLAYIGSIFKVLAGILIMIDADQVSLQLARA